MEQLAKAITAVMAEVRNIEKDATVGTGNSQYKSVSDTLVKETLQPIMAKHGLCILPVDVEATARVDRWESTYKSGGTTSTNMKQQIFTEAKCTYRLLHVSGEHMDLVGYGHGVDPQDKSAGKATTYALKKMLLYLFMVPTGDLNNLDDPTELDVPGIPSWFDNAVEYLAGGGEMDIIKKKYTVSKETQRKLEDAVALLG